MGKIIAVSNLKGGVGKTITGISLSAGLPSIKQSIIRWGFAAAV